MRNDKRFAVYVSGRCVGGANNPIDAQWLADHWADESRHAIRIIDVMSGGMCVLSYDEKKGQ